MKFSFKLIYSTKERKARLKIAPEDRAKGVKDLDLHDDILPSTGCRMVH